ncbi:MAG: pyruvate ferredoxin oxidoreductase [Planctomycetes bacterium RBG_16_43_13]|nr:MAG: pyruvate ferredoxin oxidoreductase [Planctomycetes bacterium RBG_16_43_13]
MNSEVKIGGFGGQGVILAGIIIGKAATIYDRKNAVLTQSFGPEARGSSCGAQLIISDDAILYPYVKTPNVLVVISQDAYNRFEPELAPNGTLLFESELIKPKKSRDGIKMYSIPATRFAEELGRKMVLNIVMVGFFTAVTGLLGKEAVRKSVADSVPRGTEELNLKAFEKGYEYGLAEGKKY